MIEKAEQKKRKEKKKSILIKKIIILSPYKTLVSGKKGNQTTKASFQKSSTGTQGSNSTQDLRSQDGSDDDEDDVTSNLEGALNQLQYKKSIENEPESQKNYIG